MTFAELAQAFAPADPDQAEAGGELGCFARGATVNIKDRLAGKLLGEESGEAIQVRVGSHS